MSNLASSSVSRFTQERQTSHSSAIINLVTVSESRLVLPRLALLTGLDRAASVYADTDVTCFSLGKEDFWELAADTINDKRQRFEDKLEDVAILGSLFSYDRSVLCDAAVEVSFNAGEVVLEEGEKPSCFYIIMEGEVDLFKDTTNDDGSISKSYISSLTTKESFGELSLFKKIPQVFTVKASKKLSALSFDKGTFIKILPQIEYEVMAYVERFDPWL